MQIKETIHQFLNQFPELTEIEREELASKLNVKLFKKKNILQAENKIPASCFFVLKGLVRQYHSIDGVLKTSEFYSEFNMAIPSEYYSKKTPSECTLQCLEDSLILIGEEFQDVKLIQEYPILQNILMQMTEEEWLKSQKKFSSFKLSSPEQRYLNFLHQRKDLHNRVSNSQIANYLGMTPESLSRIRKRLLHKDKNG